MNYNASLISLHGGHSGQFCNHASDSLESIVRAYIEKGFSTVGITEHMPPTEDRFVYPEEEEAGLTAADLLERFGRYFGELDRLSKKYRGTIRILRGFETETIPGWQEMATRLIRTFRPDYVVGSVHHVAGTGFDMSEEIYGNLARRLGSVDALYEAYFDAQYEMIATLKPFVVGHFDIIRIFDPDYVSRLRIPKIRQKVERNLALIKTLHLVLDYNQRPRAKGGPHPYLYPDILRRALELGIPVVPGDDSHGKDQAGQCIEKAVKELATMGFSTNWPLPDDANKKG